MRLPGIKRKQEQPGTALPARSATRAHQGPSFNPRRLMVLVILMGLAALLVAQGIISSTNARAQSKSVDQLQGLATTLTSQLQKQAKDFRSATTQSSGDPVSDLALARTALPSVSELRWWDRSSLDSAYSSPEAARAIGFGRLADAERLMAGNEKMLSVASFARMAKVPDPVLVLSARHADRVIQVLHPSADLLDTFRRQAPPDMVVALVQDGQIISLAGGPSLDLTALDVATVGSLRLSVAYQLPPPATPWLGTLPLQLLAALSLALAALAPFFLPLVRRRPVAPSEPPLPASSAFRPAAVSALPSGRSDPGEKNQDTARATTPVSSGPGYEEWFGPHGLVFSETPSRPLPDSSQLRALCRALVEQLGGLVGKSVILSSDGRALSESLAKWATEALTSAGAHVQAVAPLPISAVPFAMTSLQGHPRPVAAIWMGSEQEEPNHSGMRVYQGSVFWSPEEYGRWRLRMADRLPAPTGPEGEVIQVPPAALVPGMIDRLAVSMQVDRPIRAVADFGNGPLAALAPEVWEAIGIELIPLHGDIDTTFPNQVARAASGWPSLASTVRQFRADFGVGVSVDGASLVLVDEAGNLVPSTRLAALLAADALLRHPGARIAFHPDGLDEEALSLSVRTAGGIPAPSLEVSVLSPLSAGVELVLATTDHGLCVRFQDDQGVPDALIAFARLAMLLSSEEEVLSARLAQVSSTP